MRGRDGEHEPLFIFGSGVPAQHMRPGCVLATALVAVTIVATVAADATSTLLWPIPQSVQCDDNNATVSPQFTVSAQSSNSDLAASMARYQVRRAAHCP